MLETDLPELGVVHIARPCSQKWSEMTGDARVRFCAACQCKVYDFAEISSEEARLLLRRNAEGGRICARIFKRLDGTVLTRDCPRGFSHGWRCARKLLPGATGAALILVILITVFFGVASLFGDNIRRLFAMTGDIGLGGEDVVTDARPAQKPKRFGPNNTY